MRVILAPFLQAFVFKGSPQCAWCFFFISAELLMGRGFGCLHASTVQNCDHCKQISQMNETLINLAELLFFQKALSLGWLQTYIFVNVTDNRKIKERKERNEESFKQSCFELPPWRCSVPTLHLDMCLQMATWAHLCPFPRLVGCAPTPVTSCRAHLAPHGAQWWYTAYEQLLQLDQLRADLYLGSSGRKQRSWGLPMVAHGVIPWMLFVRAGDGRAGDLWSTSWNLRLSGSGLTPAFGTGGLLLLIGLSQLGSDAEHCSASLAISPSAPLL